MPVFAHAGRRSMAGSADFTDNASPDSETSATPRHRRGLWWLAGIATAVVVVAGIGLPFLLSSPERIAGLIQSSLKGAETDVSVEKVRIGWFGPTVIEGITFEPRDGSPRPVTIARVDGERGLLGMLLTGGDLGQFRVSGLEVDVVFDEDKQSNLRALVAPPEDETPDGEPTERKTRRSLVSTEVVIDQALVRIAGPWTEKPWESKPIDIDLVLEPEPGRDRSHWRVGQVQLLDEAVLDPTVAQGVLSYIAPVLADATIVGGRFSLGLESASLPVGDPGAGTLDGRLVMHEVDIGPGHLVKNVFAVLPIENKPELSALRISESSDIRFGLADRRVRHEGLKLGVPLPNSSERLDLESAGSVGLDDRSLALKLSLPLPKEMPADRPLLKTLAGKTLALSIGGTLDQPEVDMDGTLRTTVQGLVGRMAPGAAAGDASPSTDDASPSSRLGQVGSAVAEQIRGQLPPDSVDAETADAVVDLVGGILDEVGKRRAARKAADKQQADRQETQAEAPADGATKDSAEGSSTRGGLFRRLLDRVDEATNPPPAGEKTEAGQPSGEAPQTPGE
jgi:hypothetical protein